MADAKRCKKKLPMAEKVSLYPRQIGERPGRVVHQAARREAVSGGLKVGCSVACAGGSGMALMRRKPKASVEAVEAG